jgi:hypothetical protein
MKLIIKYLNFLFVFCLVDMRSALKKDLSEGGCGTNKKAPGILTY